MKKLIHSKIFYYTVYSLLFFAIIFYFDSIPNHRLGYLLDYDLWLIWSIFPILFIVHGIISKVILWKYKFYLPLIFTAVLGFIEAFLNIFDLKTSAMMTLYFVVLCFVGVAVSHVVFWVAVWIIEGIRGIKDWYKNG